MSIHTDALYLLARTFPEGSPDQNVILFAIRELVRKSERIDHLETIDIVAKRYVREKIMTGSGTINDEVTILEITGDEIRALYNQAAKNKG
jgi:predicted transcriptional regulator